MRGPVEVRRDVWKNQSLFQDDIAVHPESFLSDVGDPVPPRVLRRMWLGRCEAALQGLLPCGGPARTPCVCHSDATIHEAAPLGRKSGFGKNLERTAKTSF